MSDSYFYIMLVNSPWAGPKLTPIEEADIKTNRGVLCDPGKYAFKYSMHVDSKAENPDDFPPCDIHETGKHLFFSEKFIAILGAEGVDNIQYFDCGVSHPITGVPLSYKIANIVGLVSALDEGESDVLADDDGFILEIYSMALDESRLKGEKMVRLKESFTHIVVDKKIKEAVEKHNLQGFMFVSDEELEPGMM